uniref:Uncharacterized protein n=1 Tax=Anopheles dirus TaxID=7168 RepID=A0A182MY34_9DIPT
MRPVIPSILLVAFGVVSATNDAFNIELRQKDAEVYHEQSFGKNEFNYGYQVERTNSQFQHKVKGPDDVTYGCYGYIDPDGEKHLVYYIADRLGYRLLAPDQPTKVFTDRVANSVNRLDADLQGRKLDEKVVAWNDLYLPSTCRRLNEIVSITPPPTTERPAVVVPGANGPFGGVDKGASGQDRNQVPATTKPDTEGSNGAGVFGNGADRDHSNGNGESTTQVYPDIQESNKSGLSVSGAVPNTDSGSSDRSKNNGLGIDPIDFPPQTTYLPTAPTTRPPTIVRVPDHIPTQPAPPVSNCAQTPFAPRPKYPGSIAQFNGFVFPINRNCDDSGRNTADLLAQMQSLNEMVLKVSNTLHALLEPGTGHNRSATSDTCQQVLELLHIQQPQVPLLVYVPIMVPYLDGGISAKPPINPASYAYAKTCTECK